MLYFIRLTMTAMFALKTAKNIYIIKAISSRWTLFIYADFYIHLILFFETKSHIHHCIVLDYITCSFGPNTHSPRSFWHPKYAKAADLTFHCPWGKIWATDSNYSILEGISSFFLGWIKLWTWTDCNRKLTLLSALSPVSSFALLGRCTKSAPTLGNKWVMYSTLLYPVSLLSGH